MPHLITPGQVMVLMRTVARTIFSASTLAPSTWARTTEHGKRRIALCSMSSMTANFLQRSTAGGILFFEQVNTALVCFSIVAREHKIELTQDRLHEYGLSKKEIPADTLLRMAKELGLKAKLLRLNWEGLLQLKKAYPSIARLKNGHHVVLAGMQADPPKKKIQHRSPAMTHWLGSAAATCASPAKSSKPSGMASCTCSSGSTN
ncbi:MAG: cysteine peptidase family C39 domain-containing protein [Desulfobulbus sp.]|nr:cysteine peptidase family C39 domain-containing protein [Desulfobulbus sp.]